MEPSVGGEVPSVAGANPRGYQVLWTEWFGFVRMRTLLRLLAVAYLTFLTLVTFLTSDVFTVLVVGLISLALVKLVSASRVVGADRWVRIYSDEGIVIAEHPESGTVRHGTTAEEAVTYLEQTLDDRA